MRASNVLQETSNDTVLVHTHARSRYSPDAKTGHVLTQRSADEFTLAGFSTPAYLTASIISWLPVQLLKRYGGGFLNLGHLQLFSVPA